MDTGLQYWNVRYCTDTTLIKGGPERFEYECNQTID